MPIKPIPQTILNVANDPAANLFNTVGDSSVRRADGAAGAIVANVVNVTVVNTSVTKVNNPGGKDGDVQYNVAGVAFGGEDAFKYNPATDTLTIAGNIVAAGFKYANGASVSGGNAYYANNAGFAAQANVANTAMFAQSVNGANVIGTVGNAAVANVARSVDGANVIGTVGNAAVANVARSVDGANVVGTVGSAATASTANIATLALSVSGANVMMPLANVSVTGTTNLGTAADLRIAGGTNGQVLTSNGAGGLTWATPTGGGGTTTSLPAANITVTPTGNVASTNVQGALAELDGDITAIKGNITTLTTGLDGKVAKAGDTMTGGLVINNANLAAPSLRVRGGNVVFADSFTGNAFVFDIATKTATITGSGGVATLTGSEIYANRYGAGNVLLGSTGMGGGKVRLRDGDGHPSEPAEDDNAITKYYLDNRLANVSLSEITNTDGTDEFKVGVGTDGVVTMTTSRGSLEFGALPEPGGASHLHIMRPSGEEASSDVFFGDDFNYVKLPAAPDLGVEIGTDSGSSSHTWRFDTDGTTQFPGYTLPATDGTDGQILVTDGDGTLSWADQSISTSAQWVAALNTSIADAAAGDRIFQVNGVRYDQEGNIIAIARHGFEEGGNNYASVVKMDQLGRVLWMNKLSDDVAIDGWSVEVDDDNNVFMIGTHRVMPNPFAILVKYDGTNGEGIWGKSLGREFGAYGFDIAVGPDNNPVISGYSEDVDDQDLMIAKFDGSTGENMWNKTMGVALSDERAYGVAVNPSNNEVTIVGHQITGTNALLIAKFAADGTPVWQKSLPYDNGARGTDVVVDAGGNAYISGYFYGSSNLGSAILTLKLDSDGDVVWIREALGGCVDVGISIALGNDNDLYLCGTTGIFNGVPVYRSIILRYNATTGVPVWQRTFNHGSDWTFNFDFSEDNSPGSMIDVHGNSIVVGGGMVAIDNAADPIFSTARGYVTQLSRDNTLPTMGDFTVLASAIGGELTSGTTGDTTLTITDDTLTINTDEPPLNPGTVVVTVSYEDANYVSKAGGTMTGFLTLSADPTQDLHAATKAYVDDAIAGIGSTDTPPYRGFKAHYGRMFTDTPSITKLVIYREAAASPTSNIDTDTSSDLFQVSGLTGSDFVALLNIYGETPSSELSLEQLMTFMEAVVDNVILDGDGDINTVAVMKTNFYDNYAAISAVAGALYEGFQFYSQNVSDLPTTVTSSVAQPIIAAGFRPNLQRRSNGTVTANGWNNVGANYLVNDQVTIAGTSFQDGTSPANDVVLQIDAVDGVGGVDGYSVLSGTIPPQWPSNSINDGGDDQYDTANYITTNLASDISYNGGEVVVDATSQFGAGSKYVMTYNDSIFGLFATGVSISSIKTDGNSGFDGDGLADTGSLFNVVQTTVSQLVNGAHTLMLNGSGSVTLPDGPLLSGDEFSGVRIGFTDNDTTNGKVFQVRPGGDNYDHIHLDTGNNNNFDLFLGDDARYVKNARDGNIYISTDHNTNKTWTFGSDSTTAFPNYTFPAADGTDGQILVTDGEGALNWTTKSDSGSWTLAVGTNTVSFTLPGPGAYSIWVSGNIPNGIVTYTATIVLTNNNVPVVGSSYGWFYAGGGDLVLTAIPTQIVGTVNTISTATVATTTANVFTFGITNNTVSPQVVDWGYTKL